MIQALTKEWYMKLEESASQNFINLPLDFQLRGYDYAYIAKSYLTFFESKANSRQDKLKLAKKFLTFIRSINKNRAKQELNEEFFKSFTYFMENFSDLLAKQDLIKLETLDIMTQAIDKSQFIEDIISVDELKRRITNLEKTKDSENIIEAEWSDNFLQDYKMLNPPSDPDRINKLQIPKHI